MYDGVMTFIANAAIAKGRRVKLHTTPGQVALAGDEAYIGIAMSRTTAAGQPIAVLDARTPGLQEFVAGGAIAAGDSVTSAANGKIVTGTAGVVDMGKAVTAAAADGDTILVLPNT
jgi:hypothetical protein